MAKSQQKSTKSIDFEEIHPNRFLVRNQRLHGMIKNDGSLKGMLFELTATRRDGLLVRLQERGYRILTIEHRMSKLPKLPTAVPIGTACWYPIPNASENYSCFDGQRLRWKPISLETRDEQIGVMLCSSWIVRKWRSRGKASYAQVVQQGKDTVTLSPLSEDEALLAGFALAEAPRLPMVPIGKQTYLLPDIPLPSPYKELIQRIATQSERGWLVEQSNLELARMLYSRLGLNLRARQKRQGGKAS